MSLADHKAASCIGKTPMGYAEATTMLKRLSRRRKFKAKKRGGAVSVYRCKFCRGWHIGSQLERFE